MSKGSRLALKTTKVLSDDQMVSFPTDKLAGSKWSPTSVWWQE